MNKAKGVKLVGKNPSTGRWFGLAGKTMCSTISHVFACSRQYGVSLACAHVCN